MCNCNDNINSTSVSTGPPGPTGPQGPQGYNSFGTTDAIAVSLGANQYRVYIGADGCQWPIAGQMVYIESCGHYRVDTVVIGDYIVVTDLLYTGNNMAAAIANPGLDVGPSGIIGATGPAGSTGPTGPAGSGGIAGPPSNKAYSTSQFGTSISASTDILSTTVSFTAYPYTSGEIAWCAHVSLETSATADITITPVVNGVVMTTRAVRTTAATIVTASKTNVTIPITGIDRISDGQTILLRLTMNSYAGTTTLLGCNINYVIQTSV